MDDALLTAIARDLEVDITTTGCRTGEPRRIPIWLHTVGARYYLTGSPGRRGWYANLLANPQLTVHLKESAQAELAARAAPVSDPQEKLRIFRGMRALVGRASDDDIKDKRVPGSPLVEVLLQDG